MAYAFAIVLISALVIFWGAAFLGVVSPVHSALIFWLSGILLVAIVVILIFEKWRNKEDRYYDDHIHK